MGGFGSNSATATGSKSSGNAGIHKVGLDRRRRELIWIWVVNEEDVWSAASPFLGNGYEENS